MTRAARSQKVYLWRLNKMGFPPKNDYINSDTKILDFLSSFKQSIEKEQQEKQHEAKEIISNLIDAGMIAAINSLITIACDAALAPEQRIHASTLLIQLYNIKTRCE